MKETGRTFRDMKETVAIMIGACQMLLAHSVLKWPDEDYAMFGTLAQMTTAVQKNNPTRQQYMVLVVTWGKFFKSITDRIPVPELQEKALKLYNQVIDPYQKWFKESDAKQ